MTFQNQTIWIIGASSGIGRALAIQLAQQNARLILSARNHGALKTLQDELQGEHVVLPCDVSDYDDVLAVGEQLNALAEHDNDTIDRVIFMPALYKPDSIIDMDINFASNMIDVNIKGALYITHILLPIFQRQTFGQLVLCASVAGYTGLPNGQPYSATKAALINFAESLYVETKDYLDVKIINSGFVRTPMTAKNDFDMPMMITAERAANAIITGLNKPNFEIHFPRKFTFFLKILSLLPYRIKFFMTQKML